MERIKLLPASSLRSPVCSRLLASCVIPAMPPPSPPTGSVLSVFCRWGYSLSERWMGFAKVRIVPIQLAKCNLTFTFLKTSLNVSERVCNLAQVTPRCTSWALWDHFYPSTVDYRHFQTHGRAWRILKQAPTSATQLLQGTLGPARFITYLSFHPPSPLHARCFFCGFQSESQTSARFISRCFSMPIINQTSIFMNNSLS